MATPNLPALMKLRDVAQRLGVSERRLYNWVRRKQLAHYRVNGAILLSPDDVVTFLAQAYRPARPDENGEHDTEEVTE